MNTSSPSRDLALTTGLPPDEGVQQHRLAATWARAPAFLQGRSGLLMLAAVLAATGLLAGSTWLGTAAVLPLLYALPCAAMMAMCMKGHGGSDGNASARPGAAAGGSQSSLPQ
ncbi:hypothetical protein JYK14_08335 [Siccirubricoccus sp. KC 17139]|uniref:DUF2933 domain-containing protein n=1 Tax=Siccirubricoccus soli TaxID=2899147 RepID=A0ABT1D4N8_9PROT|nr:hypothetical protein [Siccirubricoccus soli]MCO6416174.1 hypothetical protein [Siccirubricoccus soli]MCP2682308.1 hypothetical protein [Siccirubricoccus soli]